MQLGVIGLGTMGANLARNAARNGATVAVYNRTTEKTDAFVNAYGKEGKFVACATLPELVKALKPPRPILLMVKAGDAVDETMRTLAPLVEKGDILIDAGNSLFKDTERREAEAKKAGLRFVGMGVSGGEEGALLGPSIMPGGDKDAYEILQPLLLKMAASDGERGRCVSYVGPGGAGHFVKMVHNGIEYGLMQLIAESYDLMKSEGMSNADIGKAFAAWNATGDLQSFLMEITADIFRAKDPDTGKDLLDVIKDAAGQKGTGKWTTEAAMNLGFCIPTINAAVDARILSGSTGCREGWQGVAEEIAADAAPKDWPEHVRSALTLSTIVTYMQGLTLLGYASQEYGWKLNLGEIARIWQGGCIIRSALLPTLRSAYSSGEEMEKGTMSIRKRFAGKAQAAWRNVIARGVQRGVPLPAMTASLGFYDGMRRKRLPQNLIQAQRDYFGAHTYERTDKPGSFHSDWKSLLAS